MKRILAAAVAVLALGGTLAANVAHAQLAPASDTYVTNGPVEALVRAGDGSTFIGGLFTRVGPLVGHGFAVTTDDADPGTGFADVSGGDVLCSVSDGAGGWYIGGTFTSVGGIDQASLAHVDASGELDTNFDPVVSRTDGLPGAVHALLLDDNGSLYVGGDFQRVNSPGADNRANLAEVDAADGSLRTTVTTSVKGTIHALTIVRAGGSLPKLLVLGGRFSHLGGLARGNAGAIKLSGVGAGNPDGWNPEIVAGGDVAGATVRGMVTTGDPAATQVVHIVGSFDEAGSSIEPRSHAVAFGFSASGGPSSVPTGWAPTLDGPAHAVATDDPSGAGDLYVVGEFTDVNGSPLASIARVSVSTGAPVAGFDPDLELDGGPGVVRSITVARGLTTASNQIIVGGTFDTVDGAGRYGVAAIDDDGDVLAWDPNPSDWTRTVAVDGLSQSASHGIYVGGEFTAAGPETATRTSVAKLDAAGALEQAWDPSVTDGPFPGEVRSLALAGGDLYLGGTFTAVDGDTRDNLAKVDATGPGGVDLAWAPVLDGPVNALAASATDLFVAGDFGQIDATVRNGAAKLPLSGGGMVDPTWNPDLDAGLPTCVCAIAVSGGNVYLGGEFDSAGTTTRNGVMRTPTTGDGALDDWDVDLGVGGRATAIDVFGMDVYVGGSFSSVNGGAVTRNNLLRARTDGDGAVDPTWDPNADDSVDAITVLGDDVYLAGAFAQIGSSSVPGLGRVSATGPGAVDPSWDPAPQWEIGLVAPIAAAWDAVGVGGGFESMSGVAASGFAQFASGRSATPVATIDLAAPHDFGSVDVGQHSAAFGYTIVNSGNVDLTISSISATSAAFEVEAGDCPVKLAPGATCSVSVEFVPQAIGAASASLVVDTDGGDPSVGLQGTGSGTAPPVPVPDEPKVEQPTGDAPTGEAPKADAPIAERPEAAMRAPTISIPIRCARPSRSGVVRLPIVVRSERPLAVRVSVDYADGTKGLDRCPKPNADRRFRGDVRNVDTLKRVPMRAGAAAVMVDHRRTIELKLKPGLYRVTVRAHVAPGRLSRPTRRWVRVLNR
jgi:hypothetical protein